MSSLHPEPQSGAAWPVYGHEWAVRLLQRLRADPAGSRLVHAYLFLGPAQVGKSTLARAFATALLCTAGAGSPCGECRACRLMKNGSHPDFRQLDPMTSRGEPDRVDGLLRVEQANEIVHDAGLFPVEGAYKIFLIREMHLAHPSFANKLLKTLEEPPSHVILCLTATDRSRLLPTVVSRCQTLELRPMGTSQVEGALSTGWRAPADRAALLARLCRGRLGWAVERLHDHGMWERRAESLTELERLIQAGVVERLAYSAALASQRENKSLFDLLATWTSWWRDIIWVQVGCATDVTNIDCRPVLERMAPALSIAAVQQYLYTLDRIQGYLHHTVNTRLALDALLLQMPRPSRTAH